MNIGHGLLLVNIQALKSDKKVEMLMFYFLKRFQIFFVLDEIRHRKKADGQNNIQSMSIWKGSISIISYSYAKV